MVSVSFETEKKDQTDELMGVKEGFFLFFSFSGSNLQSVEI